MGTIIIAEAGVNHNGSLETALRMVDAAAEAGADYIKFQTFQTQNLVTSDCSPADYQQKNMGAVSQAAMLKKLELTQEDFRVINEYCKRKGIGFLSTPFDKESVRFIASLNPDYIKVPSGEITNLPYLREVAATDIPVIISTGMCEMKDVREALLPFAERSYPTDKIILLHCTTEYPAPMEDVNLKAMSSLRRQFGLEAGYSDHTEGISISLAAAALGAVVIEKHFTLSREMEGPDHIASLEPEELAQLVKGVRDIEKALGDGCKRVTESERKNIIAARRSIVAARKIPKGKVIEAGDIAAKRPATGLSPMLWDSVVGSVAIRDYEPDERIEI